MNHTTKLLLAAASMAAAPSFAAQVLVNGDFETGNFSGWTVGSSQSSPFTASIFSGASAVAMNDARTADAWAIRNTPANYFGSGSFAGSPINGYSAFNGFDGSGGNFYLQQSFTFNGGNSDASLSFDWGIQSQYSGTLRSFSARLLDSNNALVSNLFSFSQPTGSYTTWAVTHTSVDLDAILSPLAAGTYKLQFLFDIPQNYSGPAQFAIDNVALNVTTTAVPEPGSLALVALGMGAAAVVRRRRQG